MISNASGRNEVEKVQYTARPDGIIERLSIAHGRQEGSEYVWTAAKNPRPLIHRRRIQDGFIQTSEMPEGDDWRPQIKLGAKPGDTWEGKGSSGADIYKFERFDKHRLKRNNKEYHTAVISCAISGIPVYTESTYAEGLGLVKHQVVFRRRGSVEVEWTCGFDLELTRELSPEEKSALE